MAARVNVRFVAILCTIVGVVFVGMAGAAYFIVKKSAADHYAAAQAHVQQGNVEEAQKSFSRAVNKERTNVVYLEAWIDSIEQLTPETQTKYADMYWKNYVVGMRQLALAKRTDVDAWERHLHSEYERRKVFGAAGRTGWQGMLTETNTALEYFLASPEANDDDAQWHRLRRYRALSNLNMRLDSGQADPDFASKTVLDFEAALRVDPSDDESAVGLYNWLMAEGNDAEGGRTDPKVYFDRAREVLDSFLAQNPSHPRAMTARLYYELQMAARPLRSLRSAADRVRENARLAESFVPRVKALVDSMIQNSPPELLTVEVVEQLHRLERVTSRSNEIPQTDRMLDAARKAHQGDPGQIAQIDFFEGVFSAESGDHERAISSFKRVMDAPQVPVSLEGIILTMLRGQAVLRRVQSAIDLVGQAEDGQKSAALQRVAEYRKDAGTYWPQGTPSLQLLDARIAFAKGEMAEAQRLAVSFQRETNSNDAEVHRLLSAIYMNRNQIGQAVEELKKFVEINPNVPVAWVQLSALQNRIGDKEGALESIDRAVQLAPDDEAIAAQQRRYMAESGQIKSDDPIEDLLVRVNRMLDTTGGVAPRYEQATGVVRDAMRQHGDDVRLYYSLGWLLAQQQLLDDATQVIDEGLSKFPDNGRLTELRTTIGYMKGVVPDGTDPVRAEMFQFNRDMREGRVEDAEKHLAVAARINPDDPEVLQAQITRALNAEDLREAERLINRATELNIDQAGGRILRSDLLHAQGRYAEALASINSVVSDGLTSVPVLYRRAKTLRSMGRIEDAVADYDEIIRLQPTSIVNIREVITALTEIGRYTKALALARKSQRIAGADPTYLHLWLSLEAEVGDSTAAMLRREDMRSKDPNNRQNNLALARVYLKLGEWAKARTVIDELRAESDDVTLVMIDSQWHAEQGDIPTAINTFEAYLAKRQQAGEMNVQDTLAYANFLQSQNQTRRAIAMLRASVGLDTTENNVLLRRLALLLLSTGQSSEAVEVIDQLIAAGQDSDGTLQLARVEAYIRGNELDKAQQAMDALDAKIKTTESAGILRCDLAIRRGDRRAALQALADTLAAHPTSARAYVRRAQIYWTQLQNDESVNAAERAQLSRDASEDLNEALRIDPANWEAYRLQAVMAMANSRYDTAVAAVAKALEFNPGLGSLRDQLIRKLVEDRDTPRAMTIIDSAVQANPANVDLRVHFARLMADLGRSAEAIRLFDAALAQRRNPVIAAQLVEYLIGLGTPDARAKARQVLGDPNINVAGTWQLKLMEAGLSMIEGNQPRAVTQARQSFQMVRENPTDIVRWFNALPPIIKDHKVRMEIAVQLGVEMTPQRVGEIMLASLMLKDPSTEPQGLSELRRLAGDSNTTVALRAGQLLGDTLYGKQDYQGAVEAWRGVLALDPNVGQSLNNMAFVLATQLGQCEQAIPQAQKALEVGGISPAIGLSTLAVAFTKCDRLDEAQQAVEQLMNGARGTPEEILAVVRQGEIYLARGEAERARESLNEAKSLLEAWGNQAQQYESVVVEFEAAMEGR